MRRLARGAFFVVLPAMAAALGARVAAGEDGKVSAVKVWTAQPDYQGPCPVRIVVEGQVTTTGPVAGLTAQFQHSDGTKSKVIAVPAKTAGAHPVQEIVDRRAGEWNQTITLQVLTPVAMSSDALAFKGRCTPTAEPGTLVKPGSIPPPGGKGGLPGPLYGPSPFPGQPNPGVPGGTPMPPPPPPPPPMPGGQGFRLTALGFRVARQTIESILETNGVGDEVMLTSHACEYQAGLPALPRPPVMSLVHGSIDFGAHGELIHGRPRVLAGSGTAGRGGLVTGDEVGAGLFTPVRGDPVYNRAHMFPLELWEGVLRGGAQANMAVVAPTLWEMDSTHVEPMPSFDGQIADELGRSSERYLREMRLPSFRATSIGDIELVGSILPGEFDRPIGISWVGSPSPIQAEQAQVTFRPITLRLTLSTAGALADANGGRFDLTYTDSSDFGGSYVLHLRIVRVGP